jgi:hypothetical protein
LRNGLVDVRPAFVRRYWQKRNCQAGLSLDDEGARSAPDRSLSGKAGRTDAIGATSDPR